MVVSREILELGSMYVDVKNVEARFNYLYVGDSSLISTNLKAVSKVTHYCVVKEPFYIRKSVVDLALKQTKAKTFELSSGCIKCLDVDNVEIVTISRPNDTLGAFPDIHSNLPEKFAKKVKIVDSDYISGILGVNGVMVDKKLLPKKLTSDFQGYVGINSAKESIAIVNKSKTVELYIMPTFNNYLIDMENL